MVKYTQYAFWSIINVKNMPIFYHKSPNKPLKWSHLKSIFIVDCILKATLHTFWISLAMRVNIELIAEKGIK